MAYKIVLTCDRTLASIYHGNTFLGFSACLPKRVIPDWFYYSVICPSGPVDENGALKFAGYGLRKIEAALLANGFHRDDVIVAHPDHLHKVVTQETKILGVCANDPLGIGPATSTFVTLWGGEGRMVTKLREVLSHPVIERYRPMVFLGGPGAWQLAVYPEKRSELGVDCVVVGEGEVTVPKLFSQVINNNMKIPPVVEGEKTTGDDIPNIVGGTVAGLVEATRGCARSCAFCVPSLRKVQSRPLKNILEEIAFNIQAGNTDVLLHGEDILLYQSDGLNVNSGAVVELFERVSRVPGVVGVTAMHTALSSVMSSPGTIEKIAGVLNLGSEKYPEINFQVGIETGSPRLIRKHMQGKVYPFSPEAWPEVVREGFHTLTKNFIVPCSTVLLGLPGEEKEDVQQTIDLVKSLRSYRSVIVPLLFTPMKTTLLEASRPLLMEDMTPRHYELYALCWDHNLKWATSLWTTYARNTQIFFRTIMNAVVRWGAGPVRRRVMRNARKHGAGL